MSPDEVSFHDVLERVFLCTCELLIGGLDLRVGASQCTVAAIQYFAFEGNDGL